MKKIFTILGLISAAASMNAQIVINEVYGGGGGGSATYINDYVELINLGSSTATLTNATLQYSSATGVFNNYTTLPPITLAPGQKYLIEMVPASPNSAGAALPTADFQMTSNMSFANGNTYTGGFSMAAGAGKVALANGAVQVTEATNAHVIDFVGYGTTANKFEGTGPAPAPDATSSVSRHGVDTNNNATDFTKTTPPTPENSNTGSLAVTEISRGKSSNFVKNTFVKNNEITFGADVKDVKVFNMFGQVVKEASVKQNGTVNVAELAKGTYIVTGTVNKEAVSQKILKD